LLAATGAVTMRFAAVRAAFDTLIEQYR